MEIKGKVHEIGAEQKVTDSFKKREVVIEYAENPSYPEFIKFEATQEKTSILDNFKKGDEVEVFFNLRGRPWTNPKGETLYFNTLNVWRINPVATTAAAPASAAPSAPAPTSAPEPSLAPKVDLDSNTNATDDLPF